MADLRKCEGVIANWKQYQIGREILATWKTSVPQMADVINEDESMIIKVIKNFHQSIRGSCTGDGSFLSPICKVAPKWHEVESF